VALQNSPGYPEGYAACYVEFVPPETPKTLQFTFNGSDSRQWAAWLVLSNGPADFSFQRLPIDFPNYSYSGEILYFESYDRVGLIGVNLQEFSAGAPFSYSANVYDPYSVSSEVLMTDSALYGGRLRYFPYRVTNTSPLVDNFTVSVTDGKNWGTTQQYNRMIQPGADTVFNMAITPPVGTPLGDTCYLHFSACSWSNAEVVDTQTFLAHTELQRGDLNFDGSVDISDLIYFVNYLFSGGPAPQPVEQSADFNCSGDDDIADLVAMVTYMFQGGPPPPCNPY
jgi:hypothetical protein